MRIYKIEADYDNFDACEIDDEACAKERQFDEYELLIKFDGSSQLNGWWPRKMTRYNEKPLSHYISNLSRGVIILERKAVDKLKGLMGNIEILPLDCDFGDYLAINVMDVLECIDYEKSEFELLSDEFRNGRPRIMKFKKYEFIKEKIEGYNVFKIIDNPKSTIFANQTFVDSVEKHGITGFKFDLVWPSDESSFVKADRQAVKAEINANITPLEEDVMNEMYKMKQEVYELIGADENDNPSKVVELIYDYVERLLKAGRRQHNDDEMDNISISLAAAWGLSVCEEYNWEWKYLEIPGKIEKSYYILSPNYWYCCPPFYFITKILKGNNLGFDGKNDNTTLLLFNMIKTLEEKKPHEKYTVIS